MRARGVEKWTSLERAAEAGVMIDYLSLYAASLRYAKSLFFNDIPRIGISPFVFMYIPALLPCFPQTPFVFNNIR